MERDGDLLIMTAFLLGNAVPFSHAHIRELTRSVRDKKELCGVIQANARYTREVAAAVKKRDLNEVNRILDRANLSRREFLSVCERLGLATSTQSKEAGGAGGYNSDDLTACVVPNAAVKADIDNLGSGNMPVFFLDAEGPGGTTALALATVLNEPETLRHLLKEVSISELIQYNGAMYTTICCTQHGATIHRRPGFRSTFCACSY